MLTFANTKYEYDANGNATQLLLNGTVMFTYHYNAQDRLVKVDDINGSTIAEYSYDPFGRRLWKDVSGTRTYFFYADEGLVAEYDASGTEIRNYGYRPDSTWTTDPLWLKQGAEYYFYQNDHLGMPQKLVKQNGAVAWSASYTVFGQATIEVETVTSNLRFPGQYFDAETGLHYNFHRYYAPGIGRYLKTDPIGFFGRDITLYTYCLNNSINFTDPEGLVFLAGALIGGVLNGVSSFESLVSGDYGTFVYSVLLGMGTGFLGGFGSGIALGALIGGITATINVLLNPITFDNCTTHGQYIASGICAFVTGGLIGAISGLAGRIGWGFPQFRGDDLNSTLHRLDDLGGVLGGTLGAYLTLDVESSCNQWMRSVMGDFVW